MADDEGKKKWMEEGRVIIAMVLVQFINTGLQLLSKVVLSRQGTFVFAYLFYRNVVGALCVLPFALLFERGEGVGSIRSWRVFFWLNVVALTGVTLALGLFSYGLKDTTATYATNFLNLIPIVTFILSTILRFEKLAVGTRHGKMKIIGAILCLGGALLTIFYRGKIIYFDMDHITHHNNSLNTHAGHQVDRFHWTRGTILLTCSCLSLGLWFISQAKLVAIYPYKLWATFYTIVLASIQLVVIGLFINQCGVAWRLTLNLQLIAIVYSGALATGATFWLISWAVIKRGPTYPSMFNPLSLIFVAISEGLLLEVPTSVGSLCGMMIVIIGIYGYLWGKASEVKANAVEIMKTIAVVVPMTSPAASKAVVNQLGEDVTPSQA